MTNQPEKNTTDERAAVAVFVVIGAVVFWFWMPPEFWRLLSLVIGGISAKLPVVLVLCGLMFGATWLLWEYPSEGTKELFTAVMPWLALALVAVIAWGAIGQALQSRTAFPAGSLFETLRDASRL